mgnify:CR=1 FL=1
MSKEDKHIDLNHSVYVDMKEDLDKIGPGMCLAKWTQVTLQLQTGHNHSCHHPNTHKISEKEIARNPSALHNTQFKKIRRREMLTGKRPAECDYCWNVEDNSSEFSDRVFKSTESWSKPHLEEIVELDWREDYNPRYVEVAFSNACNFKCSYCAPAFSTTWMQEIEQHGAYPTTDKFNSLEHNRVENKMPIPKRDPNPYVDAFWKWWPDLYRDLHTFRITGGEPLLSKHTWRVLEYIKENPNPNLTLAINTNMNVPSKLIDKLVDMLNEISPHIHQFDIYTSLESTGADAEYTRYGMEYDEFIKNCYYFLDNTPANSRLHFMTTVNLTSVPTFLGFLEMIQTMREKYAIVKHDFRVRTMISYLRWPKFLNVNLLAQETKEKYAKEWLDFVNDFIITDEVENYQVLYNEEADQIQRLADYMLTSTPDTKQQYDEFRTYVVACDKRRNTDFATSFPELAYLLNENYYGEL